MTNRLRSFRAAYPLTSSMLMFAVVLTVLAGAMLLWPPLVWIVAGAVVAFVFYDSIRLDRKRAAK